MQIIHILPPRLEESSLSVKPLLNKSIELFPMKKESSIESSISSKKSVPKAIEKNTKADQDLDKIMRRNVIEKQKSP